jgi:hypothetical protein
VQLAVAKLSQRSTDIAENNSQWLAVGDSRQSLSTIGGTVVGVVENCLSL